MDDLFLASAKELFMGLGKLLKGFHVFSVRLLNRWPREEGKYLIEKSFETECFFGS